MSGAAAALYRPAFAVLWAGSVAGLGVSLWAHAASLLGVDPRALFAHIWIVQLLLVGLLLPIAGRLVAERSMASVLRFPKGPRLALLGLTLYYAVHFYAFLLTAADHLDSPSTWRVFSSGWMVMFSLCAVVYWTRLREPGLR